MATTIQAGQLADALQRAQRIGRVEEDLTIAGCDIVLQSLSPDEYTSINEETKDLEDIEYFHAYVEAHVGRALCEIGGQDLRDVRFIEDAAPPGALLWVDLPSEDLAKEIAQEIKSKTGAQGHVISQEAPVSDRVVKYERHDWIRRKVLSTWSREAINVVWRKLAEVLALAEERAKEGVVFRIPEETDEDKFRRLFSELQEVGAELPDELTGRILKEGGLIQISSSEELKGATERVDRLATEQEEVEPAPEPPKPTITQEELSQRMGTRTPLNQQATGPIPPRPRVPQAPAVSVQRRPPVSEELRAEAEAHTAQLTRSERIAEIESVALEPAVVETPPSRNPARVVEESARSLRSITDQPPPAGLNPRFKPPGR